MQEHPSITFRAKLEIIGINPFVSLPKRALAAVFKQAGKDRSPIPVRGTVNGHPYRQSLVRHLELWRLYINTSMLKKSPERIGERLELTIQYDPEPRTIQTPPAFTKALKKNKAAAEVYAQLNNSTQNEIIKYLSKLKTQESLEKNIVKAINFLLGKERFIGRDLSQQSQG